ncbi:VacJ family lipoprotein [Sulfurimonas sp.]|uniref:MlaA family lipoprotein n=1 Tax=Sulfurimonas sp. TaxID=2022749 RepID=UPI003565468D
MKIFISFVLILTFNVYASEDFEDSFENEFEQELVAEEKEGEVFDPLYGYNRVMTDFNDVVMINVFQPVIDGYKYVVPRPARKSIDNFFNNLYYPISLCNNLLQLKFKHSGNETLRFITNSTLGLLGLFDVADEWFDIKPHKEDFGQTLGHYGVGSGFPIVIPFLGQSNLRDFGSLFVDAYADPIYWYTSDIDDDMVSYGTYIGIRSFKLLNDYSLSEISYEDFTKDAIDLYPFIRDAYEQNRNKLIGE